MSSSREKGMYEIEVLNNMSKNNNTFFLQFRLGNMLIFKMPLHMASETVKITKGGLPFSASKLKHNINIKMM